MVSGPSSQPGSHSYGIGGYRLLSSPPRALTPKRLSCRPSDLTTYQDLNNRHSAGAAEKILPEIQPTNGPLVTLSTYALANPAHHETRLCPLSAVGTANPVLQVLSSSGFKRFPHRDCCASLRLLVILLLVGQISDLSGCEAVLGWTGTALEFRSVLQSKETKTLETCCFSPQSHISSQGLFRPLAACCRCCVHRRSF